MNKKYINNKKGGVSFGLEILFFILILFIIWVLTGGPKEKTPNGPFVKPENGEIIPNEIF